MLSYFFALKFYYINKRLSLKSFNNLRIALIIKGEKRLFASKKQNHLLTTKNNFEKIIENKPFSISNLNIDKTFKIAWASFMRMGELTYIVAKTKNATFVETNLIRLNIFFAKGNQYAILFLKQSKTNTEYTGVHIILAAKNKRIYPGVALKRLFIQDLCSVNTPVFSLQFAPFSY